MTDTELGWIAGIFEGEGCLTFSTRWRAVIGMTDEDIVRRFHELVGIGSVVGPYQLSNRRKDGAACKPQWRWEIGGQEDVLNFVALMIPMMGARRTDKMLECMSDLTKTGTDDRWQHPQNIGNFPETS